MPQTPAQLANLRPFRNREEALPTLKLAWAAKKRNAQDRKLRKSRAKGKVTHARLADLERRVLDLERLVASMPKPDIRKPAKPKPTVGEDIPTLAKPAPAVADAMAGKQVDEPPTPANPG